MALHGPVRLVGREGKLELALHGRRRRVRGGSARVQADGRDGTAERSLHLHHVEEEHVLGGGCAFLIR